MQRGWSLLFLIVPVGCGVVYLLAALGIPPLDKFWLPPNYNQTGASIDRLFGLTHVVAAVVLFGTMGALSWFCWAGSLRERTSSLVAHHTALEVVWSLIPAAILIGLAVYQFQSWNENKLYYPQWERDGQVGPKPPQVKVVAKRFGWEFYYAGPDGLLNTFDDVFIENLLVVPTGEDVVLYVESRDVVHSFFVPGLRIKQDVVPGLGQYLWFRAQQAVELEIVCAELCGWGHTNMQARLRLVPRAEFDRWIDEQILQHRAGQAARLSQGSSE
ncbi:MAG TPA: cytochrome c oxidase subunit II [Pirellulaceae bacterium]|nr:cytochrome c oxidase subunit II [Pirellulaceae bacterium]